MKLKGLVTSEELDSKLSYIESVREECVKIIADQEAFRKQLSKLDDRLSMKISKFEID
jgi:hypothetical protein